MTQVIQSILEPFPWIANAGIVVGRSAESIELRAITIGEYSVVAVGKRAYRASREVERRIEARTLHIHLLRILREIDASIGIGDRIQCRSLNVGSLHTQLLLHLYISLLCPWHVLAQQELNLDKVFASWVELRIVVIESVFLTLAWTENVLGSH